jgi:hypothetical protein
MAATVSSGTEDRKGAAGRVRLHRPNPERQPEEFGFLPEIEEKNSLLVLSTVSAAC